MSEKSTEQPGGYPDGLFYKQILIGVGWICQTPPPPMSIGIKELRIRRTEYHKHHKIGLATRNT